MIYVWHSQNFIVFVFMDFLYFVTLAVLHILQARTT